jgi:hypothetical protein
MSHVDEGLIHAWLDGAFAPDDPEFARIEAHLAECEACRNALEIERRIRERAADVLGAAAPDAVRVEPFQRILDARRSREWTGSGSRVGSGGSGVGTGSEPDVGSGGGEAGQGERGRPGRGFRMPMALAATLVLAIGATFFARQMMRGTVTAPSVEMTEAEMMEAVGEQDAAASGAAPSAASPPSPGAAAPEQSEPAFAERRVAAPPPSRDEVAAADIVPPSVTTRAQVGTTAVVERSAEAQAAPPVANEQPVRSQEETRRLDSLMRNFPDSALRLEEVVVTGLARPRLAQIADADAAIAVDRLGDAGGTVVWTLADPDTVAARLGMRPLGLAGFEADSVQLGLVGGAAVARTVYTVEGQPVELLQWATGSLNAEAVERRQSRERQAAAGEGVRADVADVAAKAVAPVAPAAFRLDGLDFILRGGVSADSLAALAARVARIE